MQNQINSAVFNTSAYVNTSQSGISACYSNSITLCQSRRLIPVLGSIRNRQFLESNTASTYILLCLSICFMPAVCSIRHSHWWIENSSSTSQDCFQCSIDCFDAFTSSAGPRWVCTNYSNSKNFSKTFFSTFLF